MSGAEITFRYDPDAGAAEPDGRWRELMERGGVVMRDGVAIGTFGPAVRDSECPWLVVAPYVGEDPWRTETPADERDPRWEWVEAPRKLSDPAPRYVKGRCRHTEVVPVEAGGELVAQLCLTCDTQLPGEWKP